MAKEQGAVFRRHLIADAGMRALRIVLLLKRTGDDLRFQHATEQLPIKAFVAEAAMEALVHTVWPRSAQLDKADPNASLPQPFLQHPDHFRGASPAGDDIDAAATTLVEDRQRLDRCARGSDSKDQNQALDFMERFHPDLGLWPRRALGPPARPGHPQSLLPPYTLHGAPSTAVGLPPDERANPRWRHA